MADVYDYGMKPLGKTVPARNLLIGAGAYYLAMWLTLVLSLGFSKLTDRIIYTGEFEGAVVTPLVEHLPRALLAFAVGAVVVWLVESERPTGWVIFPLLLYAIL